MRIPEQIAAAAASSRQTRGMTKPGGPQEQDSNAPPYNQNLSTEYPPVLSSAVMSPKVVAGANAPCTMGKFVHGWCASPQHQLPMISTSSLPEMPAAKASYAGSAVSMPLQRGSVRETALCLENANTQGKGGSQPSENLQRGQSADEPHLAGCRASRFFALHNPSPVQLYLSLLMTLGFVPVRCA